MITQVAGNQISIVLYFDTYFVVRFLMQRDCVIGISIFDSVSNQITVTVDNIDIVGNVIDTAINAGANSVNSVEFSLKDPQSYKDKVLVQAINDAKRKADIIAKTLGKNVVNVVSVNSNNSYIEARTFNSMMYAKAADSAAVGASSPIQAGDISVKANVSIVFEIN